MRAAALASLGLLLCAPSVRAQDQYREMPKLTEDEVALGFLAGRYVTPVTCKRTDGTKIEVENALTVRSAPEAGGGNAAKVTFFGIDVADLAYCYNVVERRVPDRRGSFLIHFKSFNRADKGIEDFKQAAKRGSLEYPAHRGELTERPLGTEGEGQPRTLSFAGGEAKIVVDSVPLGSDGAKLLIPYETSHPYSGKPEERKRLTLHFFPKDGDPFVLYVLEDAPKRR